MIIIVEGIDRVGKSTLCKMLSDKLSIKIFKHEGIMKNSLKDNLNETDKLLEVLELSEMLKGNLIFDRFHLTDYVYGVVQRGYNERDAFNNFAILDSRIAKTDEYAFLILVKPTDVVRSSREHGYDLSEHDRRFQYLFEESRIKNKCCVTYDTLQDAITFVDRILFGGY